MPKRQSGNKKNKQSNFAKLSIFQPNKYKFKKNCPLSVKGAPKIDYKNIKLLKRYVSENGKILPSRITNVCLLYTSPSPRDKRQSRMPSSA